MNRKISILLVALLCALLPTGRAAAQTSCDQLFAKGVKFQQTMTVASQNQAIAQFEKAKVCYDSQAKKNLCDQQIKACRNIIAQLRRSRKEPAREPARRESPRPAPADTSARDTARSNDRKVTLTLSVNYLKFKGKGGDFKKVKVNCSRTDWKVVEAPEWVSYSRNEDGELVIEAEKNPSTKEERSASLKVQCGNAFAVLTVIQEKFKKFIII